MADTIIAMPQAGKSGGQMVPIKAVDLLDGTFAIATSTGTASGINVAFPLSGASGGEIVVMATVDVGGGVYALKTTS